MAVSPTGGPRIDGAEPLSAGCGNPSATAAGAMSTQALMSEAQARKLVTAAVEAVARSQELLEQVRRGRADSLREGKCILERLSAQTVGPDPEADPCGGRRETRGGRRGAG